jgi:DMSO reductase family type II enzyme heme b subunit
MKKFLVALIIGISVILFSTAVYYGFKLKRGVPVQIKRAQRPVVEVPYVDKTIDLGTGIDFSFWDSRPSQSVDLIYQVMVLPWPKPWQKEEVSRVTVKAFHNQIDIYFYLEWKDPTEDWIIDVNRFSDASAIMFPLEEETQPSSLMMGFLVKANIWHWKASQDSEYWLGETGEMKTYADFHYPFEEEELFVVSKQEYNTAVNDLVAVRVGTVTYKPVQMVEGRGFFDDGDWKVVFRRRLEVSDQEVDAGFNPRDRFCAVAVWDGSKGDRGGRKSISDWVELKIEY